MLLVPRQLQRAGMTGNVPYYGGRFTPAQAYAASHPHSPLPAALQPGAGGRVDPGHAAPAPHPAPPHPPAKPTDTSAALQQLLDTGVITATEYHELRDRAARC